MNILGLKILTAAQHLALVEEITAAIAAKQAEEDNDDPSILESAKFAKVYNKGTATEMLETIKANARAANKNSKIALYLSIPHQMIFLLSLVPFTLDFTSVNTGIQSILGSLSLVGMAIGLPYLCDQAILMCIRNISTRVVSTWDKWKNFLSLVPVTAVSVYLNMMAPGPELLEWVCGGVVAMVPIYQIIRSVRPNFKKAGKDETKIRDEIDDLAKTKPRAVRAQAKAQAKKSATRSAAMKQAWETRRARIAAQKEAEEAAAKAAAEAEAAAIAKARRSKKRKPTPAELAKAEQELVDPAKTLQELDSIAPKSAVPA